LANLESRMNQYPLPPPTEGHPPLHYFKLCLGNLHPGVRFEDLHVIICCLYISGLYAHAQQAIFVRKRPLAKIQLVSTWGVSTRNTAYITYYRPRDALDAMRALQPLLDLGGFNMLSQALSLTIVPSEFPPANSWACVSSGRSCREEKAYETLGLHQRG
jgi:hypothetical protein